VPGGIRTHNLLIRSQKLYPVELQAQISKNPKYQVSNPKLTRVGARDLKFGICEAGWSTGLEPATTRTTIWGSTIELRPPTVTRNKILGFESRFANPVSVGCQFGQMAFLAFRRAQGERTKGGLLTFLKQRTRLSRVTPLILDAGGTKIYLQLDFRLGWFWREAGWLGFSCHLVFPPFDNSAFGAAGRPERDFS
jgi:hypothetical protein